MRSTTHKSGQIFAARDCTGGSHRVLILLAFKFNYERDEGGKNLNKFGNS